MNNFKSEGLDIGSEIRRAREALGITIREVADRTKISSSILKGIENNDLSCLPGGIFSRSFVRVYASEVKLDPEKMVRRFLAQFPVESVTLGSPYVPQEDFVSVVSRKQTIQAAVKILVVSVIVSGFILYMTLFGGPSPVVSEKDSSAPEISLPSPTAVALPNKNPTVLSK
jgi:cytoskeletal protein RodZ